MFARSAEACQRSSRQRVGSMGVPLRPQFPNGIVSSVSFVSTANTARSLAGFVSLALALTPWRSPGSFGEALSGLVGRHRSVVDLTADRPLKHGRVDEGGFGMRVARRVAARAVFDEHALDALAGNVRQLVLVYDGHLGFLRHRRIGEDAAERQGGVKERTEDAFHRALSFGGRL